MFKHLILKTAIGSLLVSGLFLSSCDKEIHLKQPPNFHASQGTYAGVVFLTWDPVDHAEYYNIERMDPQEGTWQGIGPVKTGDGQAYDIGSDLPQGQMPPGKHFRYRIVAGSSVDDDSEPVEADGDGWAADPPPVSVTAERVQNGGVKVSWENPQGIGYNNTSGFQYFVLRRNNGTGDFNTIYQKPQNDNTYLEYTDENPGDNPEYKVMYRIFYFCMDENGQKVYENYVDTYSEPVAPENGPGPVDYTRLPVNDVVSSTSGSIAFVRTKSYEGSVWAGVIKDATAEHGVPAVYRFNGAEWELPGGTYPADLLNSTSLYQMDFTLADNKLWVAALDQDSLYVYAWDNNNWSENLTLKNLGAGGSPSSVSVDMSLDDNKPYLAITEAPDYNLKVLKWNGSAWQACGGDNNGYLTSGENVFSLQLTNIGGSLYVSYLTENSATNSTLHVKRWDGSVWQTVLDWTADYLMDIRLGGNGSNPLYFISNSQDWNEWPGGVFKITSTTTVESLVPDGSTWFLEPQALTVDQDGNLFIVSTTFESAQKIYPSIYRYDGSNWAVLSGDFSGGSRPAAVQALDRDIYFLYGDAGNLANDNQPKTLKAAKFVKSVK